MNSVNVSFASAADRREALRRVEKELAEAIAEIKGELRKLGFGPAVDYTPPKSALGSWGPTVPNPINELLRSNVRISALEAQLAAIRAAVPPAAVPQVAIVQVEKPLPRRRRVRGFPLSVVCVETERADCEDWRRLELGLPVYVEEQA